MTSHPTDALTDYLEDALDPPARRGIAAHLEQCPDCRRVLEGLTAVRRRALEWQPTPPAVDPWPAVQRAVRAEPRGRSRQRRWWPIGLAAGVAAALLAIVFRTPVLPRVEVGAPTPEASTPAAALDAQWLELRSHLSADATKSVSDALTTIDVSLSELAAALSDDPGNPLLQTLYERALADKVTVLMDAMARVTPSQKG